MPEAGVRGLSGLLLRSRSSSAFLTAVGLAPLLLLSVAQWSILPLATGSDYAQYLLHAKALADGRPYGDTGYIYSPLTWGVGPALQPPVWPALLTLAVKHFDPLGLAPRVLTAAAAFGFLALAWRYLADREGRGVATLSVLFVGTALQQVYALASPNSDLPFALCVWAFISLGDRKGEWGWGRFLALGLLAGLAAGTRVLGVSLVPALVLAGLLRSPAERRRALTLAGLGVLVGGVALLVLWERLPFLGVISAGGLPSVQETVKRLAEYRFAVFEISLYPSAHDAFNDGYHLFAGLCILVGGVDLVRRYGRTLLGMTTLWYVLAVAAIPFGDVRYTWPLWPVGTLALVVGLRRLLALVPMPRTVGHVEVVVLFVIACLATARAVPRPPPASFESDADTLELFAWFGRQPDRAQSRVVFGSPRVFALHTGIPSMGAFSGHPVSETLRELDRLRITHVVGGLGPMGPWILHVERSVRQAPVPWVQVFENSGYRVLKRPTPPGDP